MFSLVVGRRTRCAGDRDSRVDDSELASLPSLLSSICNNIIYISIKQTSRYFNTITIGLTFVVYLQFVLFGLQRAAIAVVVLSQLLQTALQLGPGVAALVRGGRAQRRADPRPRRARLTVAT